MFEMVETARAIGKGEFRERIEPIRSEIIVLQARMRETQRSLVVLIDGIDRAGVNDLFNEVHEWLDVRDVRSRVFGRLYEEELLRPTFYRYWQELPPFGRVGVFAAGWTQRSIIHRVLEKGREEELERAIEHVRAIERMLVQDGIHLAKIWVHASRDFLAKRLSRAAKKPEQHRRIDSDAGLLLKRYDRALKTAERVLAATSSAEAPWKIVSSEREREMRLKVAEALLQALRDADSTVEPPEAVPERLESDPETRLDRVDLSRSLSDEEYERALPRRQRRLGVRARAARERGISTVLVFEGWDAAGKGGAIRRIVHSLDARDVRAHRIGAPSEEERRYPYLWRFWRRLPRAGKMAIFDRSWYGRVLVERVEGLARREDWERAFAEIRDFEEQIVEHGAVLLKFWLQVDRDEQLRRFDEREADPLKRFKLSPDDFRNRDRWSDYEHAADEMIARTSRSFAPWHLIPANDKRYARVHVVEIVEKALTNALRS